MHRLVNVFILNIAVYSVDNRVDSAPLTASVALINQVINSHTLFACLTDVFISNQHYVHGISNKMQRWSRHKEQHRVARSIGSKFFFSRLQFNNKTELCNKK